MLRTSQDVGLWGKKFTVRALDVGALSQIFADLVKPEPALKANGERGRLGE